MIMSWNRKKYNRKEHKVRVQMIFKELVSNYSALDKSGLFVRADRIIRDTDSKDCQPRYIVEFSVLTKKISDYDKETILRYEPKSPTENSGLIEKSKGENYKDKGISIENYRPFFVFLTISISEQELDKFEALKNRWLKAEFHKNTRPGDYSANLICSASPFRRSRKGIKILDDKGPFFLDGKNINDLTKDDYDVNKFNICSDLLNNVKKELDNAWSAKGYEYIDIYNVGHGNADYIVCRDEKSILYDIGATHPGYSLKSYPKAAHAFNQLKPNLVIISHWDADHYMGCVYASDYVFDAKWVAPFQFTEANESISINLFRLAAYLSATGKLILIDTNNAGKLVASSGINDNAIKLRMGSCTALETQNITKKNRKGLYIELGEKDDKISVLAGDVSYNSMDGSIFSKQLTFLHVPHHGSKMILSRLLNCQWGKSAVISTKYELGITEVNSSHERVLNTTFNKSVHNTSEQHGRLRSIRLLKGGLVQKQ